MRSINYDGKSFKALSNSENGLVDEQMVFHYKQKGQILTCSYFGTEIIAGHLIGLVDEQGRIDMRYHQVNTDGELMTGICQSIPELLADGKVKLHESWQWTSGDLSKGSSVLIEC